MPAPNQLDGADGHPGWSCYGGPGMGGVGGGFGDLVAGWVPGQRPLDFGQSTGFEFDPGDFLVLQIHYHYDAGRISARPVDDEDADLDRAR